MTRALDLGYTHEMAGAAVVIPTPRPGRDAARDLTARLRCLKALIDAERAGAPVAATRVH